MVRSQVFFCCVICGEEITSFECCESVWLEEYRTVYSGPEGVSVSGVGLHVPHYRCAVTPPTNPMGRWDHAESRGQPSHEIGIGWESVENSRHGFLLHDACWRVFERVVKPNDLLLERFYEICNSTPFCLQTRMISWDHRYGGLLIYRHDCQYPWEEKWDLSDEDNMVGQGCAGNPYDAISTSSLIESPPKICKSHLFAQGQDCFSGLPFEIREMIARNLPTNDVLHLRLASRSFLTMFISQTFWASRFQDGGERSYVFEVQDTKVKVDWVNLYRITNVTRNEELLNRKRVWELSTALRDMVHLRLDRSMEISAATQRLRIEPTSWRQAAADVVQEPAWTECLPFNSGCRLFHTHGAQMPDKPLKVAVSVIIVGDVQYICGLHLTSSDGVNIRLGYLNEDRQHLVEVSEFRGFRLAITSRGIRGMQVIGKNWDESEWIGDHEGVPVTSRLAGLKGIDALEVGVDGYKMVTIAAASSPKHQLLIDQCLSSLRNTALWYPSVPGPNIRLNEASFTNPRSYTEGFEPLAWVRFGGPSGDYLNHLTRINFGRLQNRLNFIAFHYDIAIDGEEEKRYQLGRGLVTSAQDFLIDGPYGERITGVEVGMARAWGVTAGGPPDNSFVSAIQLTTNWGRSVVFTSNPDGIVLWLSPLSAEAGTTITGLYASQDPLFGLTSLGVLSEDI